ncbi:MAG: HEAT repeat domain-containing protein, partial [Acidobacteria bacterium]|nr:HEAT repeat domain-containing protein [Acidobacteriota bacterium]
TSLLLFVLVLVNLAVFFGVLLRRFVKNHYFILKDQRRVVWGQGIDGVLLGDPVPAGPTSRYAWDWAAAEEALLERAPKATPVELAQLQSLFRRWGFFRDRVRRLLWGNPWQQARSALVVAQMQFWEALPAVVALLKRPYLDVRLAGVNALGILGLPQATAPLFALLPGSSGREVRTILSAVLRCLRETPDKLVPYLSSRSTLVRLVAAAALAELARKQELPALLKAAADPEPEVRAKVARALGGTRQPEAWKGLEWLATDPVWYVRLQAVAALGRIGHGPAEHLWRALQDPDSRVQRKAAVALYERLRDPVSLLRWLRTHSADRTALAGLVDELARRGVTWEAINRVCSPIALAREESQALVRELVRSRFFAATFYAIQTHPESSVRQQLFALAEEEASPAMRLHLAALLRSATLDADSRRRAVALLGRWEARP